MTANRLRSDKLRDFAPVAQLDRVLPSEGRGRTFEPCRAHHLQALQVIDLQGFSLSGLAFPA